MEEYEFVNKTLYLKKQGILVFGDLHLGYEAALRESGIFFRVRSSTLLFHCADNFADGLTKRKAVMKMQK